MVIFEGAQFSCMREIVSDEDVLGDDPRIDGTRIGVLHIYRESRQSASGLDPEYFTGSVRTVPLPKRSRATTTTSPSQTFTLHSRSSSTIRNSSGKWNTKSRMSSRVFATTDRSTPRSSPVDRLPAFETIGEEGRVSSIRSSCPSISGRRSMWSSRSSVSLSSTPS